MTKKTIIAVLIFPLFLLQFSCTKSDSINKNEMEWLKNHPNLNIGISPNQPPYQFIDEKGEVSGMFIDFLTIIEDRLDYKFKKIYEPDWTKLLTDAKEGRVDIVLQIQETDERKNYLNFTPFLVSHKHVIVEKINNNRHDITSIADLKNKKIAVVNSFAIQEYLLKKYPGYSIIPVFDNVIGLRTVSTGQADAFICQQAVATYYIETEGISNLEIVGEIDYSNELAIASRKNLDTLNAILSKAVNSITKKEKQNIYSRWLSYEVKRFYQEAGFWLIIGVLFLFVILIIGLFNLFLRKRVKQKTHELVDANKDLNNLIIKGKQAEDEISKLNRVYSVLSNINQTIVRVRNKQLLLNEVSRIAVDDGGFLMAWIGMVNTATNKVDVVASSGKTTEYLKNIDIDLNNEVRSSGPTGQAIKTGKSVFSNNIETDDNMIPWRENALKKGYRSSITLPIFISGKIVGAYTMYSGETDFFNEDEIKLLDKLAGDISFALEFIESEKKREQAEEKIRQKDQEFRKLSANVPDLIFQFTRRPDGKYYVPIASEGIKNIFGCSPEDVLDDFTPIGRVIYSEDAERVIRDIEYSAEHLTNFTCEFRVHIPGREIQWIYSKSTPERFPDGSITWYGFNTDITHKKLVEEALRENNSRLELAMQSANMAWWEMDITNGEVVFDKRKADMLGYPAEMFTHYDDFIALLNTDDIPKAMQAMHKHIDGLTDKYEIEYRILTKSGAYKWFYDIGVVIKKEENGIPLKVTGLVIDITERKRTEENILQLNNELEQRVIDRTFKLEVANKELEAFSYSVSHDLRAPLRHINGYVDLLNDRFQENLPEKARNYLNTISNSAKQMGTLIDDLLQFSRTGRQELRKTKLDMYILVNEVLEKMDPDIKNREINWSVQKLPAVFGDYSLLKQVWVNLVDNAVKYTRHKNAAEITIDFMEEQKDFVFLISDNGIGFDMKYAHKLFGVFQRLHSQSEFEGTGIGLANVQRIVNKHNGRVWAEAEPDKGATFYFTLPYNFMPADKNSNEKVVQVQNEENQFKDLTILITEDDEISERLISITVSDFSKEVIIARTGKEAIEICRSNPAIDLILMDIRLPDLNGYTATRQIRQFNKNVIIIAQTAFALSGDKEKAIEAGCNDYISKPINKEVLLSLIQKYFKNN
jgi:PAS domain S-box-containing protein